MGPSLSVLGVKSKGCHCASSAVIFSKSREVRVASLSSKSALDIINESGGVLTIHIAATRKALTLSGAGLFRRDFLRLNAGVFTRVAPSVRVRIPRKACRLHMTGSK